MNNLEDASEMLQHGKRNRGQIQYDIFNTKQIVKSLHLNALALKSLVNVQSTLNTEVHIHFKAVC